MNKFFQYISWPFIFILTKIFFDLEINGKENIANLHGPLIIVSNHVAPYDGFFLRLILGKNTDLLPVRFMGSSYFHNPFLNFLYKTKITSLIYRIFGVLEIPHNGTFEEKIQSSLEALRNKETVYLFPEGRMSQNGVLPFKKGAAALAIETQIPILPLVFKKVMGKRSFYIQVGKSFLIPNNLSLEGSTNFLFEKVTGLQNLIEIDETTEETNKKYSPAS